MRYLFIVLILPGLAACQGAAKGDKTAGPMTKWIYCYLAVAMGIPLTTRVDMPINKVKLTLGKAISMNSTFPVKRDSGATRLYQAAATPK